MHEYGGGAWWAANSILWYVDYSDQRLRQIDARHQCDKSPLLLSAEPSSPRAQRFADIRPTDCGHWLVCVCERHQPEKQEPENLICAVARDGSFKQLDLVVGADFYGSVCLSPDGRQMAWVQWDHPDMPWDTTTLMLGALSSDTQGIRLSDVRAVAGGHQEAIVQPLFSPDNELHFLSDRNLSLIHISEPTRPY